MLKQLSIYAENKKGALQTIIMTCSRPELSSSHLENMLMI